MLTDLIIAIVLITVSTILSIYISITKNLNIISGIESEKIPANKINTVIKIFNTCKPQDLSSPSSLISGVSH